MVFRLLLWFLHPWVFFFLLPFILILHKRTPPTPKHGLCQHLMPTARWPDDGPWCHLKTAVCFKRACGTDFYSDWGKELSWEENNHNWPFFISLLRSFAKNTVEIKASRPGRWVWMNPWRHPLEGLPPSSTQRGMQFSPWVTDHV